MMIKRRQFLETGLAAAAGAMLFSKTSPFAMANPTGNNSRIEVLLDEPLGTISPAIYGHFTENLSGVVYDGIWVGESSKIPNINGIRKELVEEMRKIKPPVVRFPEDVLRTAMTGATELGREISARGGQISGPTVKGLTRLQATNMTRTSSARMNSRTSAN